VFPGELEELPYNRIVISTEAQGSAEICGLLTPLDLFGGLRDGRGGGLEAYFGMGSVAEWLVGRCPAATERDGGLASKIDLLTVGVNQLDRTFDAKRSVWSYRDGYFTFSHEHPSLEI
jgi:hypothetical protein